MKYMKRLSQRELIEEGFADLAMAAAKGAAKYIAPTAYGAIKTVKDTIQNSFGGPKKYIESWKSTFSNVISDIQGINVVNKGKRGAPLWKVSFQMELRDPFTHDPVDTWIPVNGLVIKETGDKQGNKQFSLISDSKDIDVIMMDLIKNNKDMEEALKDFDKKVLARLSQEGDVNNSTEDKSTEDKPQPTPPPLPEKPKESPKQRIVGKSRSGSNRKQRSENEEVNLNQKSLLKHLQSMSR